MFSWQDTRKKQPGKKGLIDAGRLRWVLYIYIQGCTNRCSLAAGLRGNEERMRKWRGNGEEMEREWGNGEKISSFFLYILPLYPFPISKFVTFCRKMLNTAFLSRMSQKLNIRAMRKYFWVEFSARKLRKLCRPGVYQLSMLWFYDYLPARSVIWQGTCATYWGSFRHNCSFYHDKALHHRWPLCINK